MPRLKKDGTVKKGYFEEKEESAVRVYVNPNTTISEKNKIFTDVLYKPLRKMTGAIVRKYHKYIGQCGIEELEELAFLAIYDTLNSGNFETDTIIDGVLTPRKAYSYLGTVCRNFVISYGKKAHKVESKIDQFESRQDELEEDERFLLDYEKLNNDSVYDNIFEGVVESLNREISSNTSLKANDLKVGQALIIVFENWRSIISEEDIKVSRFFFKKKLVQVLKELTGLTNKDINKSIKYFTIVYKGLLETRLLSE
jgi:hypothetical protein